MVKSRRMKWAEHVAQIADSRNPYRILVRKSEGKRPLRRPRYWFADNTNCILEI
jgi:hypothetical protein